MITTIVVLPASIPQVRRRVIAVAWCLVTRHRIRTCFAEFIVNNRTGSLPLIMWASRPLSGNACGLPPPWPVPGRHPGPARPDRRRLLGQRRHRQAASQTNSAYIRIDIRRRDALTGTVASPLLGLSAPAPHDTTTGTTCQVPAALDLPDVSPAEVAHTAAKPARDGKKTPPADAPVIVSATGEDVSDYI